MTQFYSKYPCVRAPHCSYKGKNMIRHNHVLKIVEFDDHYEVKVPVPIGCKPFSAIRVFRLTKAECAEKNFTPKVGTKYRTGGWAELPFHHFGGRSLGSFLRWENPNTQRVA